MGGGNRSDNSLPLYEAECMVFTPTQKLDTSYSTLDLTSPSQCRTLWHCLCSCRCCCFDEAEAFVGGAEFGVMSTVVGIVAVGGISVEGELAVDVIATVLHWASKGGQWW